MEWLGVTPADMTLGTMVFIIVMMVLTDRLVTKARLREVQKQADAWQAAYLTEKKHVDTLLSRADISLAALKAIEAAATEDGGDDVPAT